LPFNGKPLIEWTIRQAVFWTEIRRIPIVISSDDYKIKKIFSKFVLARNLHFHERPEELARDNTPKMDVLRHVLEHSEKVFHKKYDLLIDLDPTNPLRTQKDLDNCLEIFEKKQPKTLISVTKAKKNPFFNQLLRTYKNNYEIPINWALLNNSYNFFTRQDCPDVYDVNSSIYFYNTDWLKEGHKTPLSDKTEIYEMPEWTRCDIDSLLDFETAEDRFIKYICMN